MRMAVRTAYGRENIFFRGRERYVRVFCDQMAPQAQASRI